MRNENMNQDVNLNEVKIFPTEHPNVKLEVQKKMLREDWLKQIDEKKKTHHIYQTIANMMCFIIMSKFLT